MKTNVIYNEDCIGKNGIKRLPNKSINLIIADPPYNIGKADWDRIPNYINWSGKWMLECQRVLKGNGSFYLFHNDFLQMVEIQNWINKNSKFIFKQLIVWNKRFEGYWNQLNAIVESEGNRNYSKQVEYILFYTFQGNYINTPFSVIMKQKMKELNLNQKDISILELSKNENITGWVHNKLKGIQIPTEKQWRKMCKLFRIGNKYEDLRREYEDLRYTFNNQKTHHSVWNYEIAKKNDHLTPKPIPLIENILKHSSNEGDRVLIPFVGSGNDCVACQNLGRRYIGFEISKKYCKIAQQRLEAEKTLWD